MNLKIYEYKNCGTCRKALKYLEARNAQYTAIPIREQPPTKAELKKMLRIYEGQIRKLFNTSGLDYKKLKLKESLANMSEEEAIQLLSANGNLVKRPFLLTKTGGLVGFNEDEWKKLLVQ
jgi:arsenate reductase